MVGCWWVGGRGMYVGELVSVGVGVCGRLE